MIFKPNNITLIMCKWYIFLKDVLQNSENLLLGADNMHKTLMLALLPM